MLRGSLRPTTQNRRRVSASEISRHPVSNSQAIPSLKSPEMQKNMLFQDLYSTYETAAAQLISGNSKILSNADQLGRNLETCSQRFYVFHSTVTRLCGTIFSPKPVKKNSLVSGTTAIRSSLTPFISSYNEFNRSILEEWRQIYRKVLVEIDKIIHSFRNKLQEEMIAYENEPMIAPLNSNISTILLLLSHIKESFDIMFQKDIQEGQTKLSEIVSTILSCNPSATSMPPSSRSSSRSSPVPNPTYLTSFTTFHAQMSNLSQISISWIMDYSNLSEIKARFQEMLNDYLSRLDLQDQAQQLSSRTVSSNETAHYNGLSAPQYVPGTTLEQIIENGAVVLEKENPDFFSDLREMYSKEFGANNKTICEQKNEISQLMVYKNILLELIFEMKKYTDGNIFQQNMKDISLANGNIENKNLEMYSQLIKERIHNCVDLENELLKLQEEYKLQNQKLQEVTREMEEYKKDNERISKLNAEQSDRYSSFLAKMAMVIGTDAKEESLLSKLEERGSKNQSSNVKTNQQQNQSSGQNIFDEIKSKLSIVVGEKLEIPDLLNKLMEFKKAYARIHLMKENDSLDSFLSVEKDIQQHVFNLTKNNAKPGEEEEDKDDIISSSVKSMIRTVEQRVQKSEKELINCRKLLLSKISDQTENASSLGLMELLNEFINQQSSKDKNYFTNEDLHKIFSPVLEVIDSSSKTDAAIYLPEISYFFLLMHQSIQQMKVFTSDLNYLFDKFDFKLPNKDTEEYEKVKKCCETLTMHLRSLEPSQMHSVVFHTLSRLIIFIEALSANL